MRGHGHDASCAVIGQNEIGGKDGHFLSGERVYAVGIEKEAFFFVVLGGAHQLVLLFNFLHKGLNVFFTWLAFGQLSHQRMLGRHQHEGCAVECVLAGGEDLDHTGTFRKREIDQTAVAFADPVFLHGQDTLRPAGQAVAVFQKFLGIGGNFEKPLIKHLLCHFRAAAPAQAALHLFIGQHRVALDAEIDGGALFVGQALFIHPDKEKLLPAVVFRITGGQLSIPVIAEAHPLELLFHLVDVFVSPF